MTTLADATPTRRRVIAYRVVTGIVVGECAVGGTMDLLRVAPFFPVLQHLGYPDYFADIFGVAKLLAAAALLSPRLPTLREWAYAGSVFAMVGAAASHVLSGDGAGAAVAPLCFAGLALVSRSLNPRA